MECIVYKNVLAWRGIEKLYLDARTSDVNFVFKSKDEKLPAHKCILASISPVFDAMFFGPHKQSGDITIIDSTPDAFKQFLQFFYLSSVKLTSETVPEVMYLGKEYMLNDCLTACSDFCESTLTLDNICWGYELAILFDQNSLQQFCERKICENTSIIFKSSSFLSCEANLLRRILQLNSLQCDESVMFDGCMEWAKAVCIQKQMDPFNMDNIRSELADLFDEIRFGRMKLEHFYQRYRIHGELFTEDDFKEIVCKIALKQFSPRSKDDEEVLYCDRRCEMRADIDNRYKFQTGEIYDNLCIDKTRFRSNYRLILKGFVCSVEFCGVDSTTEAKIRVNEAPNDDYCGNLLGFTQTILRNSTDDYVEFIEEIEIKAGVLYEIEFELETGVTFSSEKVKKQVRMERGIIIDFFGQHYRGCEGLVKCLHFKRS